MMVMKKVCKSLYKKDALTIVSNAYSDFQNLLLTKRGNNESFRNSESRFATAIAKMKSHSSKTLPESLTALCFCQTATLTPLNEFVLFHLLPLTMPNQQPLWKMKKWWIQLHTIQLLPFYVNVIPTNPTPLTHPVPICPHFLDHGGIEAKIFLSRLRNLRRNLAVKLVVFGVTETPITLLMERWNLD